MKNCLKFFDTVEIRSRAVKEVKDSIGTGCDLFGENKALVADIVATHAGRLTLNNGLYLPKYMKEGASSFVEPYNKPVLLHHDDLLDPIGRVVEAKYVDTSARLIQNAKDEEVAFALRDMATNKSFLSLVRVVDFLAETELLKDPNFHGLGHILATVIVPDKEAAEKILDGRYLSVSIGASTDRAICSVCKQDWVEDGPCEHIPGKTYDEKLAFLIAGKLQYEELSFVNRPADVLARIVSIRNGVEQVINPHNSSDKQDEASESVTFHIEDAGGYTMKIKDKDKKLDEDEDKKKSDLAKEDPKGQEGEEKKKSEEPTDDTDSHYEDMIKFGLKEGLIDEDFVNDKKLTPKQRKKLPKSVFCKPSERKYPVPDCAHARVAMAYAKKYGESSSVIACIRRKAKALGCPFSKKKKNSKEDSTEKSEALVFYDNMIKFGKVLGLVDEELATSLLSEDSFKEVPDVAFCDSLRRRYLATDAAHIYLSAAFALYNDEASFLINSIKKRALKHKEDFSDNWFDELKQIVKDFKELQKKELEDGMEVVFDEANGIWRTDKGKAVFFSKEEVELRKSDKKEEEEEEEEEKEGCECDGLKDQVDALRSELKDIYNEYEEQQTLYESQLQEFKDALVSLGSSIEAVTARDSKIEEQKKEELSKLSTTELLKEAKALLESDGFKSIRDMVDKGLSGEPDGKIENPTLSDNIDPTSDDNPYIEYRRAYNMILEEYGIRAAQNYWKKLQFSKLVPVTVTPESIDAKSKANDRDKE